MCERYDVKNLLKLVGGATIGQGVALAATPVLTRIYSPEEFGQFAVFLAVVMAATALSAGRYDMAVPLPADDRDAVSVAKLALAIVLGLSTLLAVAVGLVWLVSPDVVLNSNLQWLYLVPITVFVGGVNLVLYSLASRRRAFGRMGTSILIRQAWVATTQIGLGLVGAESFGLAAGMVLGSAAALVMLIPSAVVDFREHRSSTSDAMKVAKRYSGFLRHSLPATALGVTANNAQAPMIGVVYGATSVGYWSLSQRVLMTPTSLVGQAYSDVFYRNALDLYRDHSDLRPYFYRTLRFLFLASVPPFLLVAVLGPQLFRILFGEEWEVAGYYAAILVPWMFLRFLSSPVSRICMVVERNEVDLWIQVVKLVAMVLPIVTAAALDFSFEMYLWLATITGSIVNIAFLIVYRYLAGCQSGRTDAP